nr:DUF6597 domain-containing transcriptional factor [Parapedobacter pyrenivorans]
MEFHRFAPIPPLVPYVQYFWTLANADEIPAPYTFTTIADGLPGLIFHRGTPEIVFTDLSISGRHAAISRRRIESIYRLGVCTWLCRPAAFHPHI